MRRRISVDDVRRRSDKTARLRRLDNYLGGGDTLSLYEADLRDTVSFWRTSSFSDPTSKVLLSLLAEQSQSVGWATFDAGNDAYAAKMFTMSLKVARRADDGVLAANAMALLAYQRASLGKPDVGTATASWAALDSGAPAAVRALLQERLSFTYAVAGQPVEAAGLSMPLPRPWHPIPPSGHRTGRPGLIGTRSKS